LTQQTTSKSAPLRGSPLAQRIGSAILGVIIATYLAIITYTKSGQLRSTKELTLLVILWLIGLIALGLLARPRRRRGSKIAKPSAQ
jgi:hypothetical protein